MICCAAVQLIWSKMKIYATHRTQCPGAVAAENRRTRDKHWDTWLGLCTSTQTLGWSTWEWGSSFLPPKSRAPWWIPGLEHCKGNTKAPGSGPCQQKHSAVIGVTDHVSPKWSNPTEETTSHKGTPGVMHSACNPFSVTFSSFGFFWDLFLRSSPEIIIFNSQYYGHILSGLG